MKITNLVLDKNKSRAQLHYYENHIANHFSPRKYAITMSLIIKVHQNSYLKKLKAIQT